MEKEMNDYLKMKAIKILINSCLTSIFIIGTIFSAKSHDIENHNLKIENNTIKSMFYSLVDGVFKHCGHWKQLNDEAKKWRIDTPPALKEKVDEQVNTIEKILGEALPENQKAVHAYLPYYFIWQCDHLKADFQATPQGLLTKFLFYPSQYWATIAYLNKAKEMKISIEDTYLKFYTENQDVTSLKEGTERHLTALKHEELAILNKPAQPALFVPPPPPLTSKAIWKARLYTPKETTKNKTKKSTNSSEIGIMESIKNGTYVLKKVLVNPEKKQPTISNPWEAALRKRFDQMRPTLEGTQ